MSREKLKLYTMKINFIIGVALIMLTMSACNKNELPTTVSSTTVNCDSLLDNPESVFYGLNNPDDHEDDLVNKLELKLGLALTSLMEDAGHRNALLDTSNYVEGVFDLVKYANLNPTFESDLNTILANNTYCILPEIGSLAQIDSALVYESVDYYPVISYYNYLLNPESNSYIVSIGTAVNDSDQIPGWYVSSDYISQHLVSEGDSSSDVPILIIGHMTNDENYAEPDSIVVFHEDINTLKAGSNFEVKVVSYQVKNPYRWENGNNKTDFRVNSVFHSSITGTSQSSYNGSTVSISKSKIKEITKSQVQNSTSFSSPQKLLFSVDEDFFAYAGPEYISAYYEHDWYYGLTGHEIYKKYIYTNGQWVTIKLYIFSRYKGEYYGVTEGADLRIKLNQVGDYFYVYRESVSTNNVTATIKVQRTH